MIIYLPPSIQTDEGVALSLQVIGIVGVSVSLVALTATIITFIVFRYTSSPLTPHPSHTIPPSSLLPPFQVPLEHA